MCLATSHRFTGPGKLTTFGATGRAYEGTQSKAINIYNAFPRNSPTSYTVTGTVFTTPTSFLLDTGAAVSILRHDVWNQAKPADSNLHPWTGQPLVSVDGTPLTLYGYTVVPIHLADLSFECTVVIADGLTTEAILGIDFLEANKCTLDMGNRTLCFPGSQSLRVSPASSTSPVSPITVSLVDTVRIPPESELEVMAHVHTDNHPKCTQLTQPCMLEQTPLKRLPVCVARALVTPSPAGVPIRLLNPSAETVTVYKHTSVAIMEPIDSASISQVNTEVSPPAHRDDKSKVSNSKHLVLQELAFKKDGSLTHAQSKELLSFLLSYADIFAENANDVGHTNKAHHRIYTGDSPPIRQPPR